jgi:hypothetical protein
MNRYPYRYAKLMEKAAVDYEHLPATLLPLIEKFENAVVSWQQADESTKADLFPILVKTDAVISANIYQLYKDRLEAETVDKVKLMALRAKALQLKWKLKKT